MSGKQLQQFDVLWPDLADRQEEAGWYNNNSNIRKLTLLLEIADTVFVNGVFPYQSYSAFYIGMMHKYITIL